VLGVEARLEGSAAEALGLDTAPDHHSVSARTF